MSPRLIGEVKENVAVAHGYFKTGFYSMDCAFNPTKQELGIPYGTVWEIYGAPSTAKSTTAYCLASMLSAHLKTGWVLMDVEDAYSAEYVLAIGENMGMSENTLIVIAEGQYHNDKLTNIFEVMHKQEVGVGIIDSLGMLAAKSEILGELGDANMGARARMMYQWCRKFFAYKNDLEYIPKHATVFMINHQLQNLGGYGMNRPGGAGKDYGAGVRVHLAREKIFDDGSFLLKGTIKKLRWMGGGTDNEFQFVSKVGYGLHRGLSAIIDCKELGLLTMDKGIVKTKEVSHGRFSGFLQNYDDNEKFRPFYELIEKHRREKENAE